MRESLPNVIEVFGKAVEIESAEERASWLDDVCGNDTRLRTEVEQLIAALNAAGDFMRQPAVVPNQPMLTRPKLDAPTLPDRYRAVSEVGRGGMGVVWRVVDDQFGRPLAVKVMLPSMVDVPQSLARFEREAQLTGSLQHPAIPPVVDRGRLEDHTPFFSMKLVEGRTLAELIAERPDAQSDLSRFLGIFEQACQAVGYAHSQGVIHRDLKPANIMVGAFGEVQVMDWGMAKRIPARSRTESFTVASDAISPATGASDGQVADTIDYSEPRETSVEQTDILRIAMGGQEQDSRDREDLTRDGNVMGTLAYMSPEQARGEVESLDARCDVFALGAILCEILTHERLYSGPNIWQKASQADHSHAFTLLDRSGVEEELIELCKSCLAAEADERPSNGSTIAEAVRKYDDNLQEKLQRERAEHAAAEARTVEQQKRARVERSKRRISIGLAAAMMLLLVGGGGAAWWYQRNELANQIAAEIRTRQAREDIVAAMSRAVELRNNDRYKAAETLLAQARRRLADIPEAGKLAIRLEQADADLAVVRRLDEIRVEKAATANIVTLNEFAYGRDGAFADVFREYGIDIFSQASPDELGELITASAVTESLIAALDDWSANDEESRQRILAVTHVADDDAFRNRLRDPALWRDKKSLIELADRVEPVALSPAALVNLANRLVRVDARAAAVRLGTKATTQYPGDFWLRMTLAKSLYDPQTTTVAIKSGKTYYELIAHCHAAMAIRPENAGPYITLGNVLLASGHTDEARAAFRRAIELDSNTTVNGIAHSSLGSVLEREGRWKEAEAALQRAIHFAPHLPTPYYMLGVVQKRTGRLGEAEASYRQAISLDPNLYAVHHSLGILLTETGRLKEAEAAYRRAIELNPKNTNAQVNLGSLLSQTDRLEEAEAVFRRAIEIDPNSAEAHVNLGALLRRTKRLEEAEASYGHAIELAPKLGEAYRNLGNLLKATGRLKEAESAYRRWIEVAPHAEAYDSLGFLLKQNDRMTEAEAAFRKAIELDANHAGAHCNLGLLLIDHTDRFEEGHGMLQRGHAIGSTRKNWRHPSAQWVAEAEKLVIFDRALTAFQNAEPSPAGAAERLALAEFALVRKSRPRSAAKLYQLGLDDSKLGPQTRFRYQYNAACAALLCVAGKVEQGTDQPDAEEAAKLRRQALAWLNANVDTWKDRVDMNPRARATAIEQLRRWQTDPDLAIVRGRAINKLPEEDREGWRKLWAELAAILNEQS